jgi:hypothetical protein
MFEFAYRMFVLATLPMLLSALLSLSGQSDKGPDWLTTNSPINPISGNTITTPYQYIEILDPASGLFRMAFDFGAGAFPQGQVSTLIRQTSITAEDFRVDGYQDLTIDITLNLTQGRSIAIQQRSTRMRAICRSYIASGKS